MAQVADNGLSSLVYFIVLREMMHHWNVVEIQLEQLDFSHIKSVKNTEQ